MTKLSKGAKALLADITPRVGAAAWQNDSAARDELIDQGLIKNGGLTRKGLTARERVMDEKLDEAFGE